MRLRISAGRARRDAEAGAMIFAGCVEQLPEYKKSLKLLILGFS